MILRELIPLTSIQSIINHKKQRIKFRCIATMLPPGN